MDNERVSDGNKCVDKGGMKPTLPSCNGDVYYSILIWKRKNLSTVNNEFM